jgi:hypothetical protein
MNEDLLKPFRHPFVVMAFPVACGLIVALGLSMGLMALHATGGDNYRHVGFLSEFVYSLIGAAGGFWLGVYWAHAFSWVQGPAEKAPSPGLIATATLIGSVLLYGLSGVVSAVQSGGIAFTLAVSVTAAVAGAFGAAALARKVKLPRWHHRAHRAIHMGVVSLLALVGMVFISLPTSTFPGPESTLDTRRQWALKTFDTSYQRSEEYLAQHPGVRAAVGRVLQSGPIPGPNRTATSPGELMGDFTIQVVGDRGTGVAHLKFLHMSSHTDLASYRFSGHFEHEGRRVALEQAEN